MCAVETTLTVRLAKTGPKGAAIRDNQSVLMHNAGTLLRRNKTKEVCVEGKSVLEVDHELERHAKGAKHIVSVWLGGNKLVSVPSGVALFQRLTVLDLSHNALEQLDEVVCSICSLTRLLVSFNKLRTVPAALGELHSLRHLALDGNPLWRPEAATSFFGAAAVADAVASVSSAAARRRCVCVAFEASSLPSIEHSAGRKLGASLCVLGESNDTWAAVEPRLMAWKRVELEAEDWDTDTLKDRIFEQMGLRERHYRLLQCPGTVLEQLPENRNDEREWRWDEQDNVWLLLEYSGPTHHDCRCATGGSWGCVVHSDDAQLARAMASVKGMEQELKKGLNPDHTFRNGQTLLEMLLRNSGGRDDVIADQVKALFRYGAFCPANVDGELARVLDLPMTGGVLDGFMADKAAAPPQQLQGTSLKDYAVLKRLGQHEEDETKFSGVCSRVFLAHYRGQRCVLKVQNAFQGKSELHNDLLQQQFVNEAAILSSLPQHPNIISLLHHFRDRVDSKAIAAWTGEPFEDAQLLVMPLLPRNMQQQIRCRRNRNPPFWTNCEFASCAIQLLSAVQCLQDHHIVHRDLKPDNVLCRSQYIGGNEHSSLVLCDFGMSIQLPDEKMTLPYSEKGFGVGGASNYLPPEIALAQPGRVTLDYSKSDNWAVGRVLHGMLSVGNKKPYAKDRPTYSDDMYCDLPDSCCAQIRELVRGLLRCEPFMRLSAGEALKLAASIPKDACFLLAGQRYESL